MSTTGLKNLYLLKFNNFYNRKTIRYETVEEYLDAAEHYISFPDQFNFKPNDGVTAQWDPEIPETYDIDIAFDYLLVVNPATQDFERWYVLDKKRIKLGQYRISCYRDLLAENLDALLNSSTVYLEKGYISNINNPLIYNLEKFSANEIKQSEIEIKENSYGFKWLVGYVNKPNTIRDEGGAIIADPWPQTIETESNGNIVADYTIDTSFDRWEYTPYVGKKIKYIQDAYLTFDCQYNKIYRVEANKNGIIENKLRTITSSERLGDISTLFDIDNDSSGIRGFCEDFGERWLSLARLAAPHADYFEADSAFLVGIDYESLKSLIGDGLTIYSTVDRKFRRYSLAESFDYNAYSDFKGINPDTMQNLYNNLKTLANNNDISVSFSSIDNFRMEFFSSTAATLSYTDFSEESFYSVTGGATGHAHLNNETFDMFAIPVPDIDERYVFNITYYGTSPGEWYSGPFNIKTSKRAAWAMAQTLIQKYGSGGYDLQLLPYCPIPALYDNQFKLGVRISSATEVADQGYLVEGFDFQYIRDSSGQPASLVFWCRSNSREFVIPYDDPDTYTDATEVKCINQLNKYQLVSGDYSSGFEFNKARNGGLSGFTIDFTYKPYTPFIRVAPIFGGLYNTDFNDMRGLVCNNTNYSVTRASSAWETFERNNITYRESFRREMDYLEDTRDKERFREIFSAVAGSITTGAQAGVTTGMATLNPIAGVAAGAIGTVASAIGGVADVMMNEQLFNLSIDYKKDQFNYSLRNIQAQPDNLVAVGAQTINNKTFPLLVVYSCSETEKEAFKNKLKYNGMTVGAITEKVSDYLNPTAETYIKGQLIRMGSGVDDAHYMAVLANELTKGTFITKQ